MSYFRPYMTSHNPSYSYYPLYSNPNPPRYMFQSNPEYPPPLYFEHPLPQVPPVQFINSPSKLFAAPPPKKLPPHSEIDEIPFETSHGNFFKDPQHINDIDLDIFINAMKEQIILLRDLEKLKEKLAFTEKLHIEHIFKRFDKNPSAAITLKEFRQALSDFGLAATEKETYLVIRHYSQDDKLRPPEFESLFLPKSGYMKSKLLQKDRDPDFIFKQETTELCKDILAIHLRLEISWEKFKQKLKIRNTNLKKLFKFINTDQREEIEAAELKQILEKNSMFPTSEEVEFVFFRFDERKKGQVGFLEFVRVLTTTPLPPVIPKLENFIEIIKKQMEKEKVIEQKKVDLMKMREFEFDKVYKMFDENESNGVSWMEFKRGITEQLDIKADDHDIMLVYQTYNINNDGKLSKEEFKKMILPSDRLIYQKLIFQPGALSKKNEGNVQFVIGKIFELMLEAENHWRNAKKNFEKQEETLKLLFKYMDYDKDDLLKETDFKNFLQENGFAASSSEISAIIRRFDRNGDCNIDLEEFLSELGTAQRVLKIEMNYSDDLISLFKGIKDFFAKIEKARATLLRRYDFNVIEILEIFDADKSGQVSIHELKKGFNVFGVELKEKECYLICRRYSESRNYFLSYDEFSDLFNLHGNIRKKIEMPGRRNYLSGYKKEGIISHETKQNLNTLFLLLCNFETYWDGIKTTMQQKKFDIPQAFKNLDVSKDNIIDFADIEKFCQKNDFQIDKFEIQFILFLFEPHLTGQIKKDNFVQELSPIENFEKVAKKFSILEDINEILRELIKVCREIEGYKQIISKQDFNMKELFLMLDKNGTGVLTKNELLQGLRDKLKLDVSDGECRVLMREYCLDNDLEIMSFDSFKQIFYPVNSSTDTQSSFMSMRSSRANLAINKEDIKNIGIFFKNVIQAEKKAEKFRQALVKKKVDLIKIFKVLDSQDDGFLSGDDFIKFIIKSDISSNKSDINLLVSRFDKDKSETISREEFIMELLPTPASFGDKGEEGELLRDLFTEQLIRLKIMEQRKIELIKRKSFRIYELFNLLDENESAAITNVEFRAGLYDQFDIKTTWEEINLLMYKYSRNKDEITMELEDFKRFFIPITSNYKNTEAFSKQTGRTIRKDIDENLRSLIGKFFTYLINYEAFMRILRNELKERRIKLKEMYSLLNTKKAKDITWENFKDFALKHEISSSEEEIKLLFSIYDINGNGRLSEQEFIFELTPRELPNIFRKQMQNLEYLKIIMLEMKRLARELEKWRMALFQQQDFKIVNLFKMFDLNDSFQISKSEMYRFFRKHGVMTTETTVELIMTRFSLDDNNLMSFEEFCVMLMPAGKVKNMEKIMDSSRYGYDFQRETWMIIKRTLAAITESEREFEILRRSIKIQNIHLEGIFRLLDRNDKGQITREYFAEFMQKNKILIYPLDIKCIIKRLDKRNTGHISKKGFVDELSI